MPKNKQKLYNILSLVCGIWFLLVGWIWVYWISLIIAYPFAIAGFIFWRMGKDSVKIKLNFIAGYLLLIGLVVSIGSLLVLVIAN